MSETSQRPSERAPGTKIGHTRGPWYVVTGPPNGVAVHWSLDGQVCPLRWTDGLNAETERRVLADARLIAAAPDLLEAARHVVMEWRLHGQLTDSCRVLEAAITKAEG